MRTMGTTKVLPPDPKHNGVRRTRQRLGFLGRGAAALSWALLRVRVLWQQRGVRTWGRGAARGLMSVGKLQEDRVGFSLKELKDKSCPHTSGGVCIGCLTLDPLLHCIPKQDHLPHTPLCLYIHGMPN